MGFRDRLQKSSDESEPNNSSPLANRLCDALQSIGGSDPRLAAVCRGFARHLRKNPVPDDDILSALEWVERMVTMVRTGEPDTELTPDTNPPESLPDYHDENVSALLSGALAE